MDYSKGSYMFGEFSRNDRELNRLEAQATAALDTEKMFWKKLGLTQGMNVLDLACGPGIISCELAKKVFPGKVVGLDFCEDFIKRASQRLKANSLNNLSFQKGDVYNLNLPQNTFDFIYARFLFQHLEKPLRALKSISNVLKPGGMLCVVDVDDDWLAVYPSLPAFDSFTKAAFKGQKSKGGDRNVGQKMVSYMHKTGLKNVKAQIEVVTSFDLGLKTFLGITTYFKRELMPISRKEQTQKELDSLAKLSEQKDFWGAVGVFVVTGCKAC